MTSAGLQAVQCIFSNAWRLFNSWHVPGTNVSPAMWLVFLLVIPMGFKMVFGILGMTGVFASYDVKDNLSEYVHRKYPYAEKVGNFGVEHNFVDASFTYETPAYRELELPKIETRSLMR